MPSECVSADVTSTTDQPWTNVYFGQSTLSSRGFLCIRRRKELNAALYLTLKILKKGRDVLFLGLGVGGCVVVPSRSSLDAFLVLTLELVLKPGDKHQDIITSLYVKRKGKQARNGRYGLWLTITGDRLTGGSCCYFLNSLLTVFFSYSFSRNLLTRTIYHKR